MELLLEHEDLETILERFDVSPQETLMTLFDAGLIDCSDVTREYEHEEYS